MKEDLKPGLGYELTYRVPQEKTVPHLYPEAAESVRPVRFPIPEYKRATVVHTVTDDDTGTFSATLRTRDAAAEVHAFYADSLLAQGWKMVLPSRGSSPPR